MNKIFYPLLLVIFLASISSCGTKIQCLNQTYYFVWFYTSSINDTLPDTAAIATPYKQGTNFQAVADSGTKSGLYVSKNTKMLQLQQVRPDCDLYDWQLVLVPSGRKYLLKNFSHYGKTRRQGGTTDPDCYNDFGVTVNDSAEKYSADGSYRMDIYVHY